MHGEAVLRHMLTSASGFLFYPSGDGFQTQICVALVRTGNNLQNHFDWFFFFSLSQIKQCKCRELYGKLSSLTSVCGPQCLETAVIDSSSSLFRRSPSHREYVESVCLFSSLLGSKGAERAEKRPNSSSNEMMLRKSQQCFCILINRGFI